MCTRNLKKFCLKNVTLNQFCLTMHLTFRSIKPNKKSYSNMKKNGTNMKY